jgi:hypothetical protein
MLSGRMPYRASQDNRGDSGYFLRLQNAWSKRSPKPGPITADRYVRCDENFVLVVCVSGGFEGNGVDEIVERLDDPLVELVELRRIEAALTVVASYSNDAFFVWNRERSKQLTVSTIWFRFAAVQQHTCGNAVDKIARRNSAPFSSHM